MNCTTHAIRTLGEEELQQVSGGASLFGYFVEVDTVNYGNGDSLVVSWGKEGESWDYAQFELGTNKPE
ncbi:hypothetical protein [Pseudomonas sp. LFS044]|uniref:hypothetical protein n=1 Tax=Pseudomonas sp. LFS044 TaxID=3229880 RepID=UPI003A80D3EC